MTSLAPAPHASLDDRDAAFRAPVRYGAVASSWIGHSVVPEASTSSLTCLLGWSPTSAIPNPRMPFHCDSSVYYFFQSCGHADCGASARRLRRRDASHRPSARVARGGRSFVVRARAMDVGYARLSIGKQL